MEELLRWLSENNFAIDLPPLDGKILRFDRDGKKNAWFWGVQLFTQKSGAAYIIAKVGDWKTDEEFEFKTNMAFSREDKKAIGQRIKEAQEKSEKAKEGLQIDAAEVAVQILAQARYPAPTDYMNRKLIPELFGARVTKQRLVDAATGRSSSRMYDDELLIVPMRDVNGRLWGVQQITGAKPPHKNKFFLTGQRIDGLFHTIPEDADLRGNDPLYVVEGFATGVSVHLATQEPVVVVFNSQNIPKVLEALRADSPDRPIIIAGDDDVRARRPDGTPYNAGRTKAEEAAKASIAKTCFPKFRSEENNPTDWNDLHVREGLDEVKKQLREVKAERHYVMCLGHADGSYYYTSSSNKEITAVRIHSPDQLTNLMPLAYWEALYMGKRGIDWQRAADDLKQRCRARGNFRNENVRGLGVWIDAGRVVVHLGDRLSVDGQEMGIHDLHSQYLYLLEHTCRPIHPKPLTLEECKPIHDFLNLAAFERPEQRMFLSGWIMAARLSGLLEWRPHVWITGESGSGKSTVLSQFVLPMLGDQRIRFTGGSTEPGMRQRIKSNAVPIMFDEFEPDSQAAMARVQSCLEYIRQASTDSGMIVKGSAGGASMEYRARFCAAVSAIRTMLTSQADRTRFTLIELQRAQHTPAQWEAMKVALKAFTPEYADRYFARLLKMIPAIRANMTRFEKAFADAHSQRLGQQYGPLLAGYAAICADGELNPTEVQNMVDSVSLDEENAASGETDQEACLAHLLQKRVGFFDANGSRFEGTIAESVREASAMNVVANQNLVTYGVKVVHARNGDAMLFVAASNPQLAQLFRDSSWGANWTGSLARLPGAKKNSVANLGGGVTTKGVLIPVRSFMVPGVHQFSL